MQILFLSLSLIQCHPLGHCRKCLTFTRSVRASDWWVPDIVLNECQCPPNSMLFLLLCFANEQILQPGKTGMKHKMKIRFFRELSDGVVGGGVGLLMSLSSSLHLTLICILASVLQPYWLTLQCRIDLLLGLKELGVKFHALAFSIREKLENPPPWGHASKSYGPWML